MQVTVLAVLPAQAPLKEAAAAFLAGDDHRDALSSAKVPSALALDPSFPAVPVGSQGAAGDHATLHPDVSEHFAVRGTVDVDHVANVPTHTEGHPIFSDPVIAPFLTCGGTPPVGGAVEVQQQLKTAALAARGLDGTKVAIAIMDTGINLTHLQAQPLSKGTMLDIANSCGVVPVDPAEGLYAVEIDADKVPAQSAEGQPYRGPFSSPRIVPMGTPRSKSSSGEDPT